MPQANFMGILGMVYWIMDLEISNFFKKKPEIKKKTMTLFWDTLW